MVHDSRFLNSLNREGPFCMQSLDKLPGLLLVLYSQYSQTKRIYFMPNVEL